MILFNDNMNPLDIPDCIFEFVKQHDGCNLQININSADGFNGYAPLIHYSVYLYMLTKTCNRCGYDPLWTPEKDENSTCGRHTYSNKRYDLVFSWYSLPGNKQPYTLENAFNVWLNNQPIQQMSFYGEK